MTENDKYESASYRDSTPINEPNEVDQSKVPSSIIKAAKWVREKTYGVSVREAIARGIENISEIAQDAKSIAESVTGRQDSVEQSQRDFEERYDEQIAGNTTLDETIDARDGKKTLLLKEKAQDENINLQAVRIDEVAARVDADKVKFLNLSFTYNHNEPPRYTDTVKRYAKLGTPMTLVDMVNIATDTTSVLESAPSDAIKGAIDEAKSNGYDVQLLKPHIGVNWSDGFNKTGYLPNDVDSFFKNYRTMILEHAKIASENGIPTLCIANELNQLIGTNLEGQWRDIILSIRELFPELKLTIATAGAYDISQQSLFKYVDYIGVNWYPEYTHKRIQNDDDIPENGELAQNLMSMKANDYSNPNAVSDVQRFFEIASKYGKPIWFTETGVMPKNDGLAHLITDLSSQPDNYLIIATAMEVFVKTMGVAPEVIGINWWHAQEPFNLAPYRSSDNTLTAAEIEWQKLIKEMTANDQ